MEFTNTESPKVIGDTHQITTSSSTDSQMNEMVKDMVLDSVKDGLEETKNALITQLEKKVFFKALVKELNDNIDIPFLNEKTENKIFKAILSTFINALKKIDFNAKDDDENN